MGYPSEPSSSSSGKSTTPDYSEPHSHAPDRKTDKERHRQRERFILFCFCPFLYVITRILDKTASEQFDTNPLNILCSVSGFFSETDWI